MATVQDILNQKTANVLCVSPGETVFAAASMMNEHKVGSVLVTEDGRLVGIFTERDILLRVVARRLDVDATNVGDVMTGEVACCRAHTSIDEARGVMKNRRIRHLPVVDDDARILGMISIGDLNAYENNSQEMTIHLLEQYIYGPN